MARSQTLYNRTKGRLRSKHQSSQENDDIVKEDRQDLNDISESAARGEEELNGLRTKYGRGLEPGGRSSAKKVSKAGETSKNDVGATSTGARSLYQAALAAKTSQHNQNHKQKHTKGKQQSPSMYGKSQQHHYRRPIAEPPVFTSSSPRHGQQPSLPSSPTRRNHINMKLDQEGLLLMDIPSFSALPMRSPQHHGANDDEYDNQTSALFHQPKGHSIVDIHSMAVTFSSMTLSKRLQIPNYILAETSSLLLTSYDLSVPSSSDETRRVSPNRERNQLPTPKFNHSLNKDQLLHPLTANNIDASQHDSIGGDISNSHFSADEEDSEEDEKYDLESCFSGLDMTGDASFSVGSSRPARVHVYRDGQVEIKPKLDGGRKTVSPSSNFVVSNTPSTIGDDEPKKQIDEHNASVASPGEESGLTHLGIEQTRTASISEPIARESAIEETTAKALKKPTKQSRKAQTNQRILHTTNSSQKIQGRPDQENRNLGALPEDEEAHYDSLSRREEQQRLERIATKNDESAAIVAPDIVVSDSPPSRPDVGAAQSFDLLGNYGHDSSSASKSASTGRSSVVPPSPAPQLQVQQTQQQKRSQRQPQEPIALSHQSRPDPPAFLLDSYSHDASTVDRYQVKGHKSINDAFESGSSDEPRSVSSGHELSTSGLMQRRPSISESTVSSSPALRADVALSLAPSSPQHSTTSSLRQHESQQPPAYTSVRRATMEDEEHSADESSVYDMDEWLDTAMLSADGGVTLSPQLSPSSLHATSPPNAQNRSPSRRHYPVPRDTSYHDEPLLIRNSLRQSDNSSGQVGIAQISSSTTSGNMTNERSNMEAADSDTIASRCWTVDSRGKLFESEDEDERHVHVGVGGDDEEEALASWLDSVIN